MGSKKASLEPLSGDLAVFGSIGRSRTSHFQPARGGGQLSVLAQQQIFRRFEARVRTRPTPRPSRAPLSRRYADRATQRRPPTRRARGRHKPCSHEQHARSPAARDSVGASLGCVGDVRRGACPHGARAAVSQWRPTYLPTSEFVRAAASYPPRAYTTGAFIICQFTALRYCTFGSKKEGEV